MAQEHYNAVRESDLYEYGGTRKVLLTYIAGLIIGPREEDAQGKPVGEPDKDEGYCVARQEVLAAWIGCSREEACRQIDGFVHDGWLTVDKYVDTFGHQRCRYTITATQMKKILARKMKIEEKNGRKHPVRAKHPGKKGNDKSRLNLVRPGSGKRSHHKVLEPPCDDSSQSPVITGHKALRQVITKPCDNSSIPVVGSVLPSLGKESSLLGKTPEKPSQNPVSSFPKEGKKEKPDQNHGRQVNPTPAEKKTNTRVPRRAAFRPEVESELCAAGAPPWWFESMAGFTDFIEVLNGEKPGGCTNVLTAWVKMTTNNPGLKPCKWVPVLKSIEGLTSIEQTVLHRVENSLSAKQKEIRSARTWFNRLDTQYELIPRDKWINPPGCGDDIMAPDELVLAVYRERKAVPV